MWDLGPFLAPWPAVVNSGMGLPSIVIIGWRLNGP
jgi:hypothetical protein